jgi:FkbM family methyltransferase
VSIRDLGLARRAHRIAGSLRALELVERVDARLPHGRRTTEYAGFTLVYRRRNSLVERVEKWGGYEQSAVEAIVRELAASSSRTFVDVGSNIGLVSLAVIDAVPGSRVYAFEPGPEQYRLFAETIERNRLRERIDLSSVALSDRTGSASFAVHSSRHAAGDGLRDTGRSGRARQLTVQTEMMDRWWEATGRPDVAVVKLDTEGSELLVLRGATAFIEHCRPTLFLEIHEENLSAYPYGPDDVRRYVESLGYEVEALGRADFVARPT